VRDNPVYLASDYVSRLQALPEPLRAMLLFGDFKAGTEDDPWQVLPTEWVRQAQARWRPDGGAGLPLDVLGVDVARGGQDRTVLAGRRGTWFSPLSKHPGTSTPDGPAVVALVERAVAADPEALVNVDVIGVGSSVYDLCRAGRVGRPRPVNFAEACGRRDRAGVLHFANLRAYAYWSLREALDPANGDGLALPPDPELLADLTAPRWEMRAGGVLVESKERIIKRIGRSPDCADAVVLAHCDGPAPLFREADLAAALKSDIQPLFPGGAP
jgi:hypothetical protein